MWFHWILIIFCTFKCIFWGGTLHSCVGTLPGKEGGIQGLASLVQSNQTVWSLLRTPWKIWEKVSSANSLQWKNTLNYFLSSVFGKVKNSTNHPTTIYFPRLGCEPLIFFNTLPLNHSSSQPKVKLITYLLIIFLSYCCFNGKESTVNRALGGSTYPS